jgi:hypothetical protein
MISCICGAGGLPIITGNSIFVETFKISQIFNKSALLNITSFEVYNQLIHAPLRHITIFSACIIP